MNISVRLSNCLQQINGAINADRSLNMEILTSMSEGEMLRLPNFGRKSLNELKELLNSEDQNLNYSVTNLQNKSVPDAKPYKVRKAGFEFLEDDIYCPVGIIQFQNYWIDKRDIQIYVARKSGTTWKDISKNYDLSTCGATRVYHIIERFYKFRPGFSDLIDNWTDLEYSHSELTGRSLRSLAKAGFVHNERGLNLSALSDLTIAQFRSIPDCGPLTHSEVKQLLLSYGMYLNEGFQSNLGSVWPRERDIFIYRMHEAGYKFTQVGEVFGISGARAGVIHLEVKELIDESPMFKRYVFKNHIYKEENL